MGQGAEGIIMIVLLVVIFYFFMIRPQQKRQKEINKFREGIQRGDRVITSGGIHGKVRDIKENAFVIEVANGVNITVDKNFIYLSVQEAQSDTVQK